MITGLFATLFVLAVAIPGVWMIARRRPVSPSPSLSVSPSLHPPAPGAWLDRLRAHWPLLLGIHLLIFTAMLFGARLPETTYKAIWSPGGGFSHEWAMDFWIGPVAVAVACAALLFLLITAFSSRWDLWRGEIVVFAGVLIGGAVLIFQVSPVPSHALAHALAIPFHAPALPANGMGIIGWEDTGHQNGMMLDWFCVVLIIVGGSLMMNHALVQARGPRFCRLALWVAIGPPLVFVVFAGVWIASEPKALLLLMAFIAIGYAVAAPILGALAARRIRRSNGKLHGLRLAAVEVIAVPLVLLATLVGHAVFWPILGLLILIAPHRFSIDKTMENPAVIIPMVVVAVLAALVFAFYAGRAAWRKIVGGAAAPSKTKVKSGTRRICWSISRFPELDHLDPAEKADALGGIPWWTYPLIIFRSCVVATVVGGIAAFIAWGTAGGRMGEEVGSGTLIFVATFILIGSAIWLAVYLLQMSRVRGVMRGEIARAFRGQKPPFCFACGYDLRATTGGVCPECGSTISTGGTRTNRSNQHASGR